MIKVCRLYKIIAIIAFSLIFYSCKSVNDEYSYALRIKKEHHKEYSINPNTKEIRNGSTLKGKIKGLVKITKPNDCPISANTIYQTETYILFVDSLRTLDEQVEAIPLAHVDMLSSKFKQDYIDYGKINLFEKYNSPLKPNKYATIDIDSIYIDTCNNCGCNQLDFKLPDLSLNLNLRCPKRLCTNYFVEIKALYALYSDFGINNTKIGRDNISPEIAGGFRFGNAHKFGAGLALSSGIKVFDTKKTIDLTRPTAMLYFRYDLFDKCKAKLDEPEKYDKYVRRCISPYTFFKIGGALDSATLNLYKLNLAKEDCKEKLTVNGKLPDIDMSFPISYAVGVGADFPILPWCDLSADLSFCSYAFGESAKLMSFTNVPIKRTLNFLVFRFGVTF